MASTVPWPERNPHCASCKLAPTTWFVLCMSSMAYILLGMLRRLIPLSYRWPAGNPSPLYNGTTKVRFQATGARPAFHTARITLCSHAIPSGQALSKGAVMPSSPGAATSRRLSTQVCTSASNGSSLAPVPPAYATSIPSTSRTVASSCSRTSPVRSLPPPKTPAKCLEK
jgi:hypothetical protein